ncbi:MAG: hypothetical protein ACKPKO_33070, partial [Candidatus Fonsibacter sp.]
MHEVVLAWQRVCEADNWPLLGVSPINGEQVDSSTFVYVDDTSTLVVDLSPSALLKKQDRITMALDKFGKAAGIWQNKETHEALLIR